MQASQQDKTNNAQRTLDFLVSELLPHTSRTFVKPIFFLPNNLRVPIGVTYNLLRLLDTLEDTPYLSQEEKHSLLTLYPSLLQPGKAFNDVFAGPDAKTLFASLQSLLHQTPQALEQDWYALSYAPEILQGFYLLPENHQSLILSLTQEMVSGFAYYLTQPIQTFEELDTYCYYAAGIVGKYLTKTFAEEGYLKREKAAALLDPSNASYSLAEQTGIFLQLINITRDFAFDKQQGRRFYPLELTNNHGSYDVSALHAMIHHTLSYASGAFSYLTHLPFFPRGIKAFVALPYYLAQESLLLLAKNAAVLEEKVKLTRKQVVAIGKKVMLGTFFPFYFRKWHQQNLERLNVLLGYASQGSSSLLP